MFNFIKFARTPIRKNLPKLTPILNIQSVRNYGGHEELTKDAIKERIFHLLKHYDKVDPNLLAENAHFTKDLKLDSLDTVEVVMAIEEEFHIDIPDFDADEIKTVADAIKYISLRDDAN